MLKHKNRPLILDLNCHCSIKRNMMCHSLPECSQVLGITHGRVQTARPSYIHIEALACTCTHLDWRGRKSGERERVSVNVKKVNESQ